MGTLTLDLLPVKHCLIGMLIGNYIAIKEGLCMLPISTQGVNIAFNRVVGASGRAEHPFNLSRFHH